MTKCSKCGKIIFFDSKFCKNCGNQINNENNDILNHETIDGLNSYTPNYNKTFDFLSLAFGLASVILGFLGSILFGVPVSITSLLLGIAGIVLSINVRTTSHETKGKIAFYISIIGVVLSIIMMIGCFAYGSCTCSSCNILGQYGIIGRSCVWGCYF